MVGSSILKVEWSIIHHSCFIIQASKAGNSYTAIQAKENSKGHVTKH